MSTSVSKMDQHVELELSVFCHVSYRYIKEAPRGLCFLDVLRYLLSKHNLNCYGIAYYSFVCDKAEAAAFLLEHGEVLEVDVTTLRQC